MNSIRHKTVVVRGLSLAEWLCIIEAWWLLLGFYFALRRVSFMTINKWTPRVSPKNIPFISNERLKELVGISSRLHGLTMTCLVKSLTLRWMLVRRSVPAQLRIGVLKIPSGMQAHAWVEIDQVPIGEAQDMIEGFKGMGSVGSFRGADMELV